MNRIEYQEQVSEIFDEALNNLDTDEFDTFISRVKEMIEDYN